MIELKAIHIGYHQVVAQCESLHIPTGEVSVLIGKNGSGKSTLLKSITGEIPPLKGDIFIDGKSVQTFSRKEIPFAVAFVPAHFPLVDFLKVEEYIALGRTPHTNFLGRLTDKDKKQVLIAAQSLGIDHLLHRFTSELSDGEKQLSAIARAIVQESKCILLDEPTAFLDYSNKVRVHTALQDIAKNLNKTILLSSHDIDLSLEIASSFVVIEKESKTIKHLIDPTKKELLSIAFNIS